MCMNNPNTPEYIEDVGLRRELMALVKKSTALALRAAEADKAGCAKEAVGHRVAYHEAMAHYLERRPPLDLAAMARRRATIRWHQEQADLLRQLTHAA